MYAAGLGKGTAYAYSQLFHFVAAIIGPLTANAERPISRFSAAIYFPLIPIHIYSKCTSKKHPVGCFKIERRN